ncbi:MAG TPA: Crp/Fnr family transcriptional regulator [Allosphingosinicella sp.]|jgi:CRP-like cAMP-binding protein
MTGEARTAAPAGQPLSGFASNRLLATFSAGDRAAIGGAAQLVHLKRRAILWDQGADVDYAYFPAPGTMISLAIDLEDGSSVEVASIGKEGSAGGIVSCGSARAFGRALVQIGGPAYRISLPALEAAKARSPSIRSLFCRYSDALLAQVMQSVACNAAHPMEARLCRWLLTSLDRVGSQDLPLTQAMLAEMLGVQRTTVNAAIQSLHAQGVIATSRGLLHVLDRAGIERRACECYGRVEDHFAASLPEVRPQAVDATA